MSGITELRELREYGGNYGNYGELRGITGNYGDTLLNPQLLAFRLGPATPRIAADRGGEAIEDGRRGQVN